MLRYVVDRLTLVFHPGVGLEWERMDAVTIGDRYAVAPEQEVEDQGLLETLGAARI